MTANMITIWITSDRRRAAVMRPTYAAGAGPRPSVLVHDHAPDVLAVQQVAVALVDLVQAVPAGDQLLDLEVARAVQGQHLGDVVQRVRRAEQRALDPLLAAG